LSGWLPFTGIKENITSTASAAGSLLMDLQVGGASKFNIDKSGNTTIAGTLNVTGAITGTVTGHSSLDLAIANNLSDLNSASTARTNLGLGTMATQNANIVNITGGSINGTIGGSSISSGAFTSTTATGTVSASSFVLSGTTTAITHGLYYPTTNTIGVSANSLDVARFASVASAVNYLTFTNASTGGSPSIAATGSDANISLSLTPKGTGGITTSGSAATQFSSTTSSTSGKGIYGYASAGSGTTYGGYFQSDSTSGIGLFTIAGDQHVIPFIAKGAASQSGDLAEFQNSSGTSLAKIDSSGDFWNSTSGAVAVQGTSSSSTGIGLEGYASSATGANYGGYFYTASNGGIGLYATVVDPAGKPLVVQAASSQTADIAEFKNSSGTVLAKVDASGNVTAPAIIPSGSTVATNGMYLPAANTVGISANSIDVVRFNTTASGVNYFTMTPAPANNSISLGAAGTSTDVGISLAPKGAGNVSISGSAGTQLSVTDTSSTGIAVEGYANSTTGANYGGYFHSESSGGIGLLAIGGNAATKTFVARAGQVGQTGSLTEWQNLAGTMLAKVDASGNFAAPASGYINFGSTTGTSGYGFFDNGGTLQYKNSGGSWTNLGTPSGTLGVGNGGTGTSTAFTAGSVVYAGASGVYSQDNANFFWDSTNHRLGLGTTTPGYPLDVRGSAAGTGNILAKNTSATGYSGLEIVDSGGTLQGRMGYDNANSKMIINSQNNSLNLQIGGTDYVTLTTGGNVGIGTTSITQTYTGFKEMELRGSTQGGLYQISTAAADGDGTQIGQVMWVDTHSTATDKSVAQITGYQSGSTANNRGAYLSFGTKSNNGTGPSERMRIDNSGNVGIGTTTPNPLAAGVYGKVLDVVNTTSASRALLELWTNAALTSGQVTGQINFLSGTSPVLGAAITSTASGTTAGTGNLSFWTSNSGSGISSPAMTVDFGGNVGIGTTSPITIFDVKASTNSHFILWSSSNLGANTLEVEADNDANNALSPMDLIASKFNFNSGNVGIGNTGPTSKLGIVGTASDPTLTAGSAALLDLYASGAANLVFTASSTSPFTVSMQARNVNTNGLSYPIALNPLGGNVGISTASPHTNLEVNGNIATTASYSALSNNIYYNIQGTQIGATSSIYSYGPICTGNTSGACNGSSGVVIGSANTSATVNIPNSGTTFFNGGSVGIGTTTPGSSTMLNVNGMGLFTGGGYNPGDGTPAGVEIGYNTGSSYGFIQSVYTSHAWENLVLNPGSGNVGIGTTSPGKTLDVNGSQMIRGASGGTTCPYGTALCINFTGAGSQYGIQFVPANNGTHLFEAYFDVNSNLIGSIQQNNSNNGVFFNTTSDRRVKENITDSAIGLDSLMKMQVREFNFITDPKKSKEQGFIAQELYKVYPQAVSTSDDGTKPLKKTDRPWAVDYGRLTPLIVKAVQDLKHMLDGVIADVKKLAARVDEAFTKLAAHDSEIKKLKDENEVLRAAVCKLDASAKFCHSFKTGKTLPAIPPHADNDNRALMKCAA
jgi:Chaperone of endosialidase